MKNKGFTLIELLAVIVILAIVALVATPIVLNVINSSREKARLSSAYGIVDTARLYYIQLKYDGGNVPVVNVIDDLQISGEKPSQNSQVILNDNGEISVALIYDNKCYSKEFTASILTVSDDINNCTTSSIEPVVNLGGIEVPYIFEDDNSYDEDDKGGLYMDIIDNSYRYKGSDPDNYIELPDMIDTTQLFRIVSIDEQGVKVVANTKYFNKAWDKGDVEVASCTSIDCPRYDNTRIENTYCYDSSATRYYGCNVYGITQETYTNGTISGTIDDDSSVLSFLRDKVYVNRYSAISSMINQNADFKVGAVKENSTIQDTVTDEARTIWKGKIGLLNVSDFIRAQLPKYDSSLYSNINTIGVLSTAN